MVPLAFDRLMRSSRDFHAVEPGFACLVSSKTQESAHPNLLARTRQIQPWKREEETWSVEVFLVAGDVWSTCWAPVLDASFLSGTMQPVLPMKDVHRESRPGSELSAVRLLQYALSLEEWLAVWAGIFPAYMWIQESAGWLDGCHSSGTYHQRLI